MVSDRLEDARRALCEAREPRAGEPGLWQEPGPLQEAFDHAPEAWKDDAFAAIERLAGTRATFTADDVWAELSRLGDRGRSSTNRGRSGAGSLGSREAGSDRKDGGVRGVYSASRLPVEGVAVPGGRGSVERPR